LLRRLSPDGGRLSFRVALLAAPAVAVCVAGVWAAPVLVRQEMALPGPIAMLQPMQWKGRSALMVYVRPEPPSPGQPGGVPSLIRIVGLRPGGLAALAEWTLPYPLRWIEPLRLTGGSPAWLALREGVWGLGRADGERWTWQPLCACPSVYDAGGDPHPVYTRLARDLDGDGTDELLLPERDGLAAYRLLPEFPALEPLWRYAWEKPLAEHPQHKGQYPLPDYRLLDARGTGRLDLLVYEHGPLAFHPFPVRAGRGRKVVLDGAARGRLEALSLPPDLRAALSALPERGYAEAPAFLAALLKSVAEPRRQGWAVHLPPVLAAVQAPAEAPLRAVLPLNLPKAPGKDDDAFLLAMEDLTGDRIADVLLAVLRNHNNPLSVQGEVHFFRGAAQGDALTFPGPAAELRTQGAALALPIRPRVAAGAEPVLFTAGTEVTLGAMLQLLSEHRAVLDVAFYALRPDGARAIPGLAAKLTLEDLKEGIQALILAADLDGDGLRELAISRKPGRITVYRATAQGPDLIAPPLAELDTPLPRQQEEARVMDLAGDGKEVLVFWYRGNNNPEAAVLRIVRMLP
jgi:hypothetical protein